MAAGRFAFAVGKTEYPGLLSFNKTMRYTVTKSSVSHIFAAEPVAGFKHTIRSRGNSAQHMVARP
jgi:hypothetical protein